MILLRGSDRLITPIGSTIGARELVKRRLGASRRSRRRSRWGRRWARNCAVPRRQLPSDEPTSRRSQTGTITLLSPPSRPGEQSNPGCRPRRNPAERCGPRSRRPEPRARQAGIRNRRPAPLGTTPENAEWRADCRSVAVAVVRRRAARIPVRVTRASPLTSSRRPLVTGEQASRATPISRLLVVRSGRVRLSRGHARSHAEGAASGRCGLRIRLVMSGDTEVVAA